MDKKTLPTLAAIAHASRRADDRPAAQVEYRCPGRSEELRYVPSEKRDEEDDRYSVDLA